MAIPVECDKRTIQSFLNAIAQGKPIPVPDEGWNRYALLSLAGTCQFGAMSHGPALLPGRSEDTMTAEKKELSDEQFMRDNRAAVGWCEHVAMQVQDGEYDQSFEDRHKCFVSQDDEGKLSVRPVEGFKGR